MRRLLTGFFIALSKIVDPNFLSFYKRDQNPIKNHLHRPGRETVSSRTHHQTTDRVTNMNRKSGKVNLIAKSHGSQMQNTAVENFINSGSKIMANLKWPFVAPIFRTYRINHDFDSKEGYTKALNRTGVFVKFNPENQTWALIKR